MPRSPQVLIVSASAGTGHLRAAEALHQALVREGGFAHAEHVDVLALAPSWVQQVYGGGYDLVTSRAPWIWRELYQRTDGATLDRARWGPLAQRTLFRAFQRLAASGRWSAIVCTHFLPAQLAVRHSALPPLHLVVTDFTLHRFWLQPAAGRFYAATEALAQQITLRTGRPADATGIPVAAGFTAARSAVRGTAAWKGMRALSGFDPVRPLVLVMGGGAGLGIEGAAEAAFSAGVGDLQIAVVCGRNDVARQRLLARGWPAERVRILGHVRSVPQLMAAADLVITKPGGLTTSEALAVGRPMLLTRPAPGHEEGNVRELVRLGAALPATEGETLSESLRQLFAAPWLLEQMTAAARAAGRPDAAAQIARTVSAAVLQKSAA
ncbi:MAG TPA: glycosyltransferase [Longimicrobiales bacterium]